MLKKYFPELDFSQFWDDDELALEEYVDDAPSDTLIASVENELGYKLPESYIALMKHHNGGVPYATCYVLPEGADDEAEGDEALADVVMVNDGGLGSLGDC